MKSHFKKSLLNQPLKTDPCLFQTQKLIPLKFALDRFYCMLKTKNKSATM